MDRQHIRQSPFSVAYETLAALQTVETVELVPKDMVLTSISSRCSRVKKNLNAAKPPEQSKGLVGGLLDVASVLSRFGSLLVSVAGVVTMF